SNHTYANLTAEDWSNESALINAFPIESFSRFTYKEIKEILNDFLSAVASHASPIFVRVYAEKCREFYKSNQGDTLLLKAVRNRSSVINTEKLQNQIEQEKKSAELEGELNGVKLSRLGGLKYSKELDKGLYEASSLRRGDNTSRASTSNVGIPITTTTSTDNQDSASVSPHVDNATTVLSNTDTNELDEEELPVTEGEDIVQIERAAAVAAEMAREIVEDELPIPLVKEFYEWTYALLLGKHYTSKNDALDNYEWDQENPQDALNRAALALSSIINLANEEMKDIMQPCLSGTSIEQRLCGIINDETTIEQMDNEYDCVGKLEDEIFQSLFDEKQKNSEKRRQYALRSINKMKYKYLENTIDCLELQVLDAYEYLLRNINNFEDLNINSNATESDFFNAVYPIISIVIRRTQNLQSRSDDGACQATKDALALLKKTFGVQSNQRIYGRKLDLMFIDRKHKVELCSSEWKKRDVSLETLLCQQTKNLRVSKCIFKKIVKLHTSLNYNRYLLILWTGVVNIDCL
ncbi:hypothetical protein INT45_009588, partial [Circinella minor]